MILDRLTEFFDDLAIPTSAGTTIEGDVINLEDVRDIGNGRELFWYVMVTVTATGGTSVNVQLVTDDNETLTSPTVIAQSGVTLLADLTEGTQLVMLALPLEGVAYEQYIGIQVVAAGVFTGGTISSGLTLDPRGWKALPGNTGTVA